MKHPVRVFFEKALLPHPGWVLLILVLVSLVAGWQARHFKLDASADSLVLENDQALDYFREITKRYGSSEFLILTYSPLHTPLFSREALDHLATLRDELSQVSRVESVYGMLDVPLLFSPKVTFQSLSDGIRTLASPDVDLQAAQAEMTRSPIYQDLLVNEQADTTALLIRFERDEQYFSLLNERNRLRDLQRAGPLTEAQQQALEQVSRAFSDYNSQTQARRTGEIQQVRDIIDRHRGEAKMFLGGVPMIASDMVSFIRADLKVFGLGVLLFLIIALSIIFREARWVVLPLLCCGVSVIWMVGWLGYVDWKVTVISSNFISLLLIICMSITIHLTVRYRELHADYPDATQHWLVKETVRHMARPCFYTIITTMVAFASLVVSDIRPVIDFGWMMTIGIGAAFVVCFLVFPAVLLLMQPGKPKELRDFTGRFTMAFARFTHRHYSKVIVVAAVLAVWVLAGTTRLTVENRFIDYFQEDTEIYKGMLEIDQHLGGTTPLDIVLDAPADFRPASEQYDDDPFSDPFADPFEDSFEEPGADLDDPFADPFADAGTEAPAYEDSYWFQPAQLDRVERIHDYISSLPETGKVLSVATTWKVAREINGGPLSYSQLMLLTSFIPDNLREQLLSPYISEEGNQIRISVRVIDSDNNLNRNALLNKIRADLQQQFELQSQQINLTGAVVLYNNMLQSLFDSQIKTLGSVFFAILLMFIVLFRSFWLALLAMLPNLLSASCILGLVGWIGLPLDMMTITIAAITIGIAVDDTIHYVHRFREEFVANQQDFLATMKRCHSSIGRAMYYTSLTIIAGFSILAFSNFNPTIYFGLLTGLAMAIALLANLTLLPALIVQFKPRIPPLNEEL